MDLKISRLGLWPSNREKRWCAAPGWGCSALSAAGTHTTQPTRMVTINGKTKWLRGDLYGKTFSTVEAAFAAMYERGYGVRYIGGATWPLTADFRAVAIRLRRQTALAAGLPAWPRDPKRRRLAEMRQAADRAAA